MPQKPGLSRNLAAERAARKAASQQARLVPQGLPTVHPSQLMPSPENGRKELLKIDELAETLRSDGMNTAMTVIPPDVYVQVYPQHKEFVEARVADGVLFVVHHGHRRLAAAQKAGLTEVPILVRHEMPSLRIAAIQENLQRMGLNPIEEAAEFEEALGEKDESGKRLSQRELAKRVGCSQTYVSHRVALLRLIPALQQAVIDHWLKEQQLLEDGGQESPSTETRLVLPVREAATVFARLRPDLQEAFLRGELTDTQAAFMSKVAASEQTIPTPEAHTDCAAITDEESAETPVPEPRGSTSSPAAAPRTESAPLPAQSTRENGSLPASPQAGRRTAVQQPETSVAAVTTAEEPRGVIVVRGVEELARTIMDFLSPEEVEELKSYLSPDI
ncbi:ParB/RepB/Spo0J family partition protein [Streptomyces hygroscopicus]|uniref:ParB/RepB/Spo0J family partition protein n=1 Tax=Streptomyces hygroscopicus TaxID=1912 RepID=UPI00224078B7|nr:ParB/RepB/Spo0J family partition protein [Streptomyces hygroscopicus]